jgi:AcrR family transcriptional regulator
MGVARPPADHRALAAAAGARLHRDGIQATSVDELAAEAGVTKLTLYRHFGSKDELLAQALEQRHEERHAQLVALLAGASHWRQAVAALFDWLYAWSGEPGFRGCAFVQATVEVGNREPRVRQIAAQHKARFGQALREQLDAAGFAEPEELAGQVQLLVEGATALTFIDGDAGHVRRAQRAATTVLEAGERVSS